MTETGGSDNDAIEMYHVIYNDNSSTSAQNHASPPFNFESDNDLNDDGQSSDDAESMSSDVAKSENVLTNPKRIDHIDSLIQTHQEQSSQLITRDTLKAVPASSIAVSANLTRTPSLSKDQHSNSDHTNILEHLQEVLLRYY